MSFTRQGLTGARHGARGAWAVAAVATAITLGCAALVLTGAASPSESKPAVCVAQTSPAAQAAARVADTLSHMTLEAKVGQMLMLGFPGTDVGPAAQLIAEYHPGSIILFGENITGRTQLMALTAGLRKACAASGDPLPLIATDEEGGKVQRLKVISAGGNDTSNKAWGLLYAKSPKAALAGVEAQADLTAKLFRELGLNMNLAPVVDVVTDPANSIIGGKERGYGSDAAVVTALGTRYLRRLQADGVIATAKHFPGHGPTAVDSHLDLPQSQVTKAQLDTIHLVPFKATIDAGVAAVLTAHIMYPAYDKTAPATLSHIWVTDILRGRLGFSGVVVTDAMSMGALAKHYTSAEAAVAAVKAGCDILLYDHGQRLLADAYSAVLRAVRAGDIPVSRIDSSVTRILTLKAAYGVI